MQSSVIILINMVKNKAYADILYHGQAVDNKQSLGSNLNMTYKFCNL